PSAGDVLLSLLFDHLIYDALDNTYSAALAQSWTSADDGKTWTLELRPDVTTHDGRALTAQDVAFTLNLYRDHPAFHYYGGQSQPFERIEAVDDGTVRLTLSHPVANIEALLHWIPVLPKHAWETMAIDATTAIDAPNAVGSGPFIWAERGSDRITLRANKAYWMGPPAVDALVFRTYPNADALADALQGGEVDLITQVPVQRIADLRSRDDVQVVTGPRGSVRSLLFNVSAQERSTGHPALKDPLLRLAMAHAVDKQQLIDQVLLAYGMPGLSILPPALIRWFNADIEDVAFDLQAAEQILESAGYRDTDADGFREMPDSPQRLHFRLFFQAGSASADQEARMLANWFRQVGIQVSPQALDSEALRVACCPAFDYDLMLWEQGSGPDPAFLLSTLSSAHIEQGINPTGYSNPAYDALYEQQALVTDQEERRQMVLQLQQIAFNDRPSVVLYYELAVQAFRRDRFQNWLFVPSGIVSLVDERSL
ncbi:MAG: ABC transporter substrate-binding protein, partial [Anaerolineales bacterium]